MLNLQARPALRRFGAAVAQATGVTKATVGFKRLLGDADFERQPLDNPKHLHSIILLQPQAAINSTSRQSLAALAGGPAEQPSTRLVLGVPRQYDRRDQPVQLSGNRRKPPNAGSVATREPTPPHSRIRRGTLRTRAGKITRGPRRSKRGRRPPAKPRQTREPQHQQRQSNSKTRF